MDHTYYIQLLGLITVGAPVVLFFLLGVSSLLGRPFSELVISRCVQTAIVTGLLAAFAMLSIMLATGDRKVPIDLGDWVAIGGRHAAEVKVPLQPDHAGTKTADHASSQVHGVPHYHFSVRFVFDRLSVPFVILTYILCGTIGAFASKYMHRERGFNRFFSLFALFVLGMIVTSLAGTIETLFSGWELVGLSSALLVAFFHERPAPAKNGLRVWAVYRVSDAALLIAAVVMHHLTGEGNFDKFLGSASWPEGATAATPHQALMVGLLLLLAAAGKSALVPFSGWLPRAMEGPTPSSAVFYGALSVHLGAFLLLRASPLMDISPTLSVAVLAIGGLTALFAAITGRVQTDIKSALSFASLTQVGIIVAEIGITSLIVYCFQVPAIGHVLRYLTLLHILGHGCLRTLQFVRAPTLLYDYSTMENAIGARLSRSSSFFERHLPNNLRVWIYRMALERGHLDTCLSDYLVAPFLFLLRSCDAMERRWTTLLSGVQPTDANHNLPVPRPWEELL